jgi:hypothetical protein
MTRRFITTEKAIAIALILWGGFVLYASSVGLYQFIEMCFKYAKLNWKTISLLKLFKNYHQAFLLSSAMIFAGISLLRNKKIGWTTALITLLLNGPFPLIPTHKILNIQMPTGLLLKVGSPVYKK